MWVLFDDFKTIEIVKDKMYYCVMTECNIIVYLGPFLTRVLAKTLINLTKFHMLIAGHLIKLLLKQKCAK